MEVVDLDLDTIYYDWTLNGVSITTLPSFTHEFSQAGCDTITVRVTDGNGEDQHTWVVTTVLLGVEDRDNLLPVRFYLDPNYPNPFNASTRIRFGLPQDAWTTIRIFDILGRQVATLWDGYKRAGHHSLTWIMPANLASGIYIIAIIAQEQGKVYYQENRKAVLLK